MSRGDESIQRLCSLHQVDVQKQRKQVGKSMEAKVVWDTVQTGVNCRIMPMSTRMINEYAQRGFIVSHAVYFSSDPDLTTDHRLRFKGRNLEVIGSKDFDEMNRLWKVICKEDTKDPDRGF